jgi:hypothetical protein
VFPIFQGRRRFNPEFRGSFSVEAIGGPINQSYVTNWASCLKNPKKQGFSSLGSIIRPATSGIKRCSFSTRVLEIKHSLVSGNGKEPGSPVPEDLLH